MDFGTGKLIQEGISFTKIETHEKPRDCVEAAQVRSIPLEKILKSIVLEDKEGNALMACLPAHKKLDLKKIAWIAKSSRLSFAKPEKVKELTGCEVGTVPPFFLNAPTAHVLWDESIKTNQLMNISIGDSQTTFMVNPSELEKLAKPLFTDICAEEQSDKPPS